LGGLDLTTRYHLEPGYVTVPDANKMVLSILKMVGHEDKSHYYKILNGAKKGLFGGKKYGSRMYQVRKEDIRLYAEECFQTEKLKLFNFEIVSDLESINKNHNIDKRTANELLNYLISLRFYQIISEEVFDKARKKVIMRVNISVLTNT
jgi:hypothetical protein